MRRFFGLLGCGVAIALVLGSGTASAKSDSGESAGLFAYALYMPSLQPGLLALLGSGVLAATGTARRRRERERLF